MEKNQLNQLLQKYGEGTCTDEERQLLEQWFRQYEQLPDEVPEASQMSGRYNQLFEKISNRIEQKPVAVNKRRLINIRWLAAASVAAIIISGMAVYQWLLKPVDKEIVQSEKQLVPAKDVQPGGDRATLTLADGSVIQLDTLQNGTLATQGGTNVIKLADGRIHYAVQNNSNAVVYNTIRTPRGGNYEVLLPDGSIVWLNASSSLRFPSTFSGKERRVELTGEGYFEIEKNPSSPFIVTANDQQVKVLGTHFNIMAYDDEGVVRTTLLEGSVQIGPAGGRRDESSIVNREPVILKPGQQAVSIADLPAGQAGSRPAYRTGRFTIADNVDIEAAIAWKNNLFWFSNADINTVMRQIARWYNVEVVYKGTISKKFSGTIPKNLNASKVFMILEQTGGVHFTIEDDKIIVMP